MNSAGEGSWHMMRALWMVALAVFVLALVPWGRKHSLEPPLAELSTISCNSCNARNRDLVKRRVNRSEMVAKRLAPIASQTFRD